MKKRFFALLLALVMLVSLFPMSAIAVDAGEAPADAGAAKVSGDAAGSGDDAASEENDGEVYSTDDDTYVYTLQVVDGVEHVLAYDNGEGYDVVANRDGALVVEHLAELTTKTVDKSMLWTVEGVNGNYAIENSRLHLTVENGKVVLTGNHVHAWSYNTDNGYVDFTTDADEIYLISVDGGVLSAFDGDFEKASGKVAFYAPESVAVTKLETVRLRGATKAAGGDTIFVGTDVHASTSSLQEVLNAAKSAGIAYTVLGGDIQDSGSGNLSTYTTTITGVLTSLSASDCYFTYGSHDRGMSTSGTNGFLDSASTGAVGLGTAWLWGISYDEMNKADDAISASASFTSWVNSLDADDHRVIIIMSHMPMHDRRDDNHGAATWLDAINTAALTNDIIFLWGHNHTNWASADKTAAYVAPGGSITPEGGSSTQINFTYALAGFIGKEVTNAWRGSTVTITDDTIYVDHYSTSAKTETKTIARIDVPEDDTPEYEFVTDEKIIVKANSDGTVDLANIKYTLTVGGEEVTPTVITFTVTFDPESIISSISNDGTITFAEGKTGTATVTINFTYDPNAGKRSVDDNGVITDSTDIIVTVNEYSEHNWSTTPVWVWSDDYYAATAKFGCRDPECEEEFVTEATVEVTENDPTCQEAKIYTYTATVTGPDGEIYTALKTVYGVEEVYVYKLVDTFSAGENGNNEYLIVSTNAAGSGYALLVGTVAGDRTPPDSCEVTINAPQDDDDIDANYILGENVPAEAVWTATYVTEHVNNADAPGFKLTNGDYYLQIDGQYADLYIQTSEKYSDSVWNYNNSDRMYYYYAGNSGRVQTKYAFYSNEEGFYGSNSGPSNVYIYERTTMHTGEMGPHNFEYTETHWGEGHATAVMEFECSVCHTTAEVHADVTSKDEEADCEYPSRTTYTATATFEGEEYTDSDYTEREILVDIVDENAKVYKLVNSITNGKKYLIVTINTAGKGNALSFWPEGDSTAVTDDAVTVISNTINGNSAIYIEARDVDDPQSIWTAVRSNSAWRFTNSTSGTRD